MFQPLFPQPATPLNSTTGSRNFFSLAIILLGASLVLSRTYGITNQSLWFDEGYTLSLSATSGFHNFIQTFAGLTSSERLQPLYYGIMFLWSRIAGTSDLALRLPSALFSATAGIIVFRIASNLSEAKFYFASVMTAVYLFSSYSIYYSQEARPYALLQLLSFALLSLWLGERMHQERSSQLFTALCVLCFFGSPFTGLLVITLYLTDLIFYPKARRSYARWNMPILAGGVSYAVYLGMCSYLVPSVISADVTILRQPLWMNFCYAMQGLVFGTTLGLSSQALHGTDRATALLSHWPVYLSCFLVLASLMLAVTSFLLRDRIRGSRTRLFSIASAIYLVAFFGVFGLAGRLNLLPRHASALFALLFILATAFSSEISVAFMPFSRRALNLSLVGYFVLNLISIYNYHWRNEYRKDDYRAIASILRQNPPVPTFMAAGRSSLLRHYGFEAMSAAHIERDDFGRFILSQAASSPEIRLVVNEERSNIWNDSFTPVLNLAPIYSCQEDTHTSYMHVYSCWRRAEGVIRRADPASTHLIGQKVSDGN